MKKFASLVSFALFFLMPSLYADYPEFYTGVELGVSKIDNNPNTLKVNQVPFILNGNTVLLKGDSKIKVDNHGFGGRGFIGFHLSPYWSIEGGYTQFADTKIKNVFGITALNDSLHEGALDAVLEFSLPMSKRSKVFAKGGLAYVFAQRVEDSQVDNYNNPNSFQVSYKKINQTAIRPLVGAGLNFSVNSKVDVELGWSRITQGQHIPTSDLAGVTLVLHFD